MADSTAVSQIQNTAVVLTAAFIIGNNSEWSHGRCLHGDIALYRIMNRFGILEEESRASSERCGARSSHWMEFLHEYDLQGQTAKQLQERLSHFLDRLNNHHLRRNDPPPSSSSSSSSLSSSPEVSIQLLLYLGGHGEAGYYCLSSNNTDNYSKSDTSSDSSDNGDEIDDSCWYFHDIVALLQQKLRSTDTVYALVDTCYSGSFVHAFDPPLFHVNDREDDDDDEEEERGAGSRSWYNHIQLPNDDTSVPSFLIVMSTTADAIAGPEWTLTQAWIQAMMMMMVHDDDATTNYHRDIDSDGAGTTPPQQQPPSLPHITVHDFVHTAHDMIHAAKHDDMQFLYVSPTDPRHPPMDLERTAFPFVISPIIKPQPRTVNYNDRLYCRFNELRQQCQVSFRKWNGVSGICHALLRTCLYPNNRMHDDPTSIDLRRLYHQMIAFRLLANNGQYRCYHYAVGTKVWCMWEDETQLYLGTIIDDKDVLWSDFLPTNVTNDHSRYRHHNNEPFRWATLLPNPDLCHGIGPCLPVRWDIEQTFSFLPVGQCYIVPDVSTEPPDWHIVQEQALSTMRNVMQQQYTISSPLSIPMDCLLRSFYSMGKELCFTSDDICRNIVLDGPELTKECDKDISCAIRHSSDIDALTFQITYPHRYHYFLEHLMTNGRDAPPEQPNKGHDKNHCGYHCSVQTVTSTIQSMHHVTEEILWTHHLWPDNGGATTTFQYCVVQLVPHGNGNTTTNMYDSPMYLCVPISSLRFATTTTTNNINDE